MIPKKQKVFDYIRRQILLSGFAPTQQEIMQELGMKGKRHLSIMIKQLIDDGMLEHKPGKSRGLELTNVALPSHYPLGRISAGTPIEAIEEDKRYDIFSMLFPAGAFSVIISGDSMIEEGLFDGDIVVLVPAQNARNGDIVYAQIDGSEATLKRIYVRPNKIILKSCNPAYAPMEYHPERVVIRAKFHKGIAMSR